MQSMDVSSTSSLPGAQLRTGAGTHTPWPLDRALKVETFFKQQHDKS
jgi:hypothetical protein